MTPRQMVALLLLGAAWGGSFLFIRIAAPALGPVPLMAGRVCIAAAALALYASVRGASIRFRGRWRQFLLLGLVNAALPFSLIATAELHLTASMAAVLIAAQPLFATLIEAVLLAQPASPRRAAGLTLGLAGVAVLVGWAPGSFDAVRGWSVAASLLGALCYAAGGIYARRRMRDVPPLTLALGQQLGAAVWLVPPALLTLPAARPAVVPITALLALALVSTAMAYVIFFRLLAEVGPVRAFTVTYVIPVFGVIWGVLVLGERPAPGMIAGLAAIVLSLLLVNAPPPARAPAVVRAGA